MDIFAFVYGTLISGTASIVSYLFSSNTTKNQKIAYILYVIIICLVGYFTMLFFLELNRIKDTERQALSILEKYEKTFDNHKKRYEFVNNVLTFLEKNKDLYPNSYKRALEICEPTNCVSDITDNQAYSFFGIVEGIANTSKSK